MSSVLFFVHLIFVTFCSLFLLLVSHDLLFRASRYVVNLVSMSLHISLFSSIFFLCFFFSLCPFVAIVSYYPYYSSSHASVKVREGSNYWGPLGYEALISPKSSQSPDLRAASKRAHMFKFRMRKESKIPLIQGQER